MEAKLIKVLEHYHLYDGDKAIATTIVGNPMLLPNLSLKNCEAIANGYDLDELAEECAETAHTMDELYENGLFYGFMSGFQKALEILGDKKFSEEDVKKAYTTGWNSCNNFTGYDEHQEFIELPDCIHSLQQTEWDCIVEMEEVYDGLDEMAQPQYSKQPKLDADGCLILKRK